MPREVYNQIVGTLKKYADQQVNLKSDSCVNVIAVAIVDDLLNKFMFIERETNKEYITPDDSR